ncbi:P44/Msp2 family outer membrane protein, partial [Campylobacter coli]|nr:P44/Msp2 family outer membrane protein [Campylobacter coli]
MIVEDIDYDIGATSKAATVNHNYGYDVDGVVGYDFGGFRVETEVGYRRATVDSYRSTLTTPTYTAAGLGNSPAGQYDYAGGSTSALSFMLNGLLDFGADDGIQGFVGGGVGVARVKAKYGLNTRGNFLDDSDT